jgi:hypothetical protein
MESQNELLAFMDKGEIASIQNRWTFEAAWEVANKGERIFYETLNKSVVLGNKKYKIKCSLPDH